MWELICHHTYDWHGLPIDHSSYKSDGYPIGGTTLNDGVAAGSGAIRLLGPAAISIPRSAAWRPLRAVRVDCTIRLTDPDQLRRTIIECDGSFKLFIFQRTVWMVQAGKESDPGTYFGYFGYHGFENDGLSTVSDGIGGQIYEVPLGQWVRLTFVHLGIGGMQLYADGQLVAQRPDSKFGIRGAGDGGIRIGNSVDGMSEALGGDIDEIRVWRFDPQAMWKDFAKRPVDPGIAHCWEDLLLRLGEILGSDRDCGRIVLQRLAEIQDRMLRRIAAQGEQVKESFAEFHQEYMRLWSAGTIDGPEMEAFAERWIDWLRSLGIEPQHDAEFKALIGSDCFKRMIEAMTRLDCDPQFIEMMRIFAITHGKAKQAQGA